MSQIPELSRNSVLESAIQQKKINLGLHSSEGQVNFYLTRKQEGTSCYEPNRAMLERFHKPERFDIVKKITIRCNTLDKALREEGLTDIDFIKLDTQGSELAILQGASSVLTYSVFGLEIEVAFAELYKGQPLFSDVDSFLRSFVRYLYYNYNFITDHN